MIFMHNKFEYDGIKSVDMDIAMYNIDTDIPQGQFGLNRNISEEEIGGKSYFYGLTEKDFEFDAYFSKTDEQEWTYDEKRKISNWLFQNEYKPFRSCDYPHIYFYAIIINKTERWNFGNERGYIKAHFKCKNSSGFSRIGVEKYILDKQHGKTLKEREISKITDLICNRNSQVLNPLNTLNYTNGNVFANNTFVKVNTGEIIGNKIADIRINNDKINYYKTENIIELTNFSRDNKYIYPIFEFTCLEDGDVSFTNLLNKYPPTIISNLKKGEKIILDNLNQEIESNIENTYRLTDFNKNWFFLDYGINQVKIIGRIELLVKFQFPVSL